MSTQLSVDEFIKQAVMEGVSNAPHSFMHTLEQSLRNDVIIEKSGSMENHLQTLIDETAEDIENGGEINEVEVDAEDEQGQGNGYHVVMQPQEYQEWMNYKEKQDKNVRAKPTLKT